MPVPNALEIASLAANRAARNGAGLFMRQTIGDFVRQQNPVHEPLAEFFVGRGDARHFDDVNAGAQDHLRFTIYDLRLTRKQTHASSCKL